MADADHEQLGALLRHRLNRLLSGPARPATTFALREVVRLGRPAFLFGSVIRNLLIGRPRPPVRDLDVVVGGVSTADLASYFGDQVARTTRFGGIHVDVRGVPLDVWPISDTWAFRHLV